MLNLDFRGWVVNICLFGLLLFLLLGFLIGPVLPNLAAILKGIIAFVATLFLAGILPPLNRLLFMVDLNHGVYEYLGLDTALTHAIINYIGFSLHCKFIFRGAILAKATS